MIRSMLTNLQRFDEFMSGGISSSSLILSDLCIELDDGVLYVDQPLLKGWSNVNCAIDVRTTLKLDHEKTAKTFKMYPGLTPFRA